MTLMRCSDKSWRCVIRHALEIFMKGSILSGRAERDQRICEAAKRFGYTQRAVADPLGLFLTYESRALTDRWRESNMIALTLSCGALDCKAPLGRYRRTRKGGRSKDDRLP